LYDERRTLCTMFDEHRRKDPHRMPSTPPEKPKIRRLVVFVGKPS